MSDHIHIAQRKRRVLGLFADFDQAFEVIADIRRFKVPGVSVDDITVRSPIEHPEIEQVLGERPQSIRSWTFFGSLFGLVGGFFFLGFAQATFLVQPSGGKPVITVPSNIVLAYEMMILFGVLATLTGFIIGARLMRKGDTLHSKAVSIDQIGILVELETQCVGDLKTLFAKHKVLELHEEAAE